MWIPRTIIAGIMAAAGVLATTSPCEAACVPAQAGPHAGALSGRWRAALDEVLRASLNSERPWGCTGAVVDLTEHDGVATLEVIATDGHAVSRDVTAPEDVLPMGQALLMQPDASPPEATLAAVGGGVPRGTVASSAVEPAIVVHGAKAPGDAATPPDTDPAEPPRPSALISALLSPRYAGKAKLFVGGVAAHVAIPIDWWHLGGWLRYDPLSTSLDTAHPDSLHELCLGASAGRTFPFDGFDLRLSLLGSAAVVMPSEASRADSVRVDGRAGLELRGLLHLTDLFALAMALDAELAPGQFGSEPSPPEGGGGPPRPLPSYTLGFGLGAELAP
jgi:hypothetical protein